MISSKKNDSQPTLESISFLDGTTLNSGEKLDKIRCKRLRVEGESIFSSDASMLGSLIVNNDIQCKGVIFGELAAEINAAEYTNLRTGWPWPIVGDIYDISLDSLYAKIVALQNTKAPINSPIFTGTVTIPGTINGNCSFSEKIPFSKGVVLYRSNTTSNNPILELTEESTSSSLIFIPTAVTPHYNPFSNNNDFVARISQFGGSGANLTFIPWGTTSCGVRVSKESLLLGCGGTSNLPTNRILFDGTLNKMTVTSPNLEISATTVTGITKSMVGLSNVDNTSDTNKPVSTATQSALDLKASQTETLAALNLKAPLTSPSFTGNATLAGNLTLNSSSFTNRMIYCGQIALTNLQSGADATIPTMYIHTSAGVTYLQNISTSGVMSFFCRDSGNVDVGIMNMSSSGVTLLRPLGINADMGLSMASGTGAISQAYTTATIGTLNTLKRTQIYQNSGSYDTGSGNSALVVADTNGTGSFRGFNFMPNASSGALNSFVSANDNLISTRTVNVGAITIAPFNNATPVGFKVSNSSSTDVFVSARAANAYLTLTGSSTSSVSLLQATNGTITTNLTLTASSSNVNALLQATNSSLTLNGTSASTSTAVLQSPSIILRDAATPTSNLTMNSTSTVIQSPTITLQASSSTFSVTSSSVNMMGNLFLSSANLGISADTYVKGKSLVIESVNNTTYASIATSTGGITLFSNTAVVGGISADSSLNFAVNQTFNNLGQKTVLVIDPTCLTISRPIKSTDMASNWSGGSLSGSLTNLNTYNGATYSISATTVTFPSNLSVQNRGGVTLSSPGTYCFVASIVLQNNDTNNDILFSQLLLGFGTAANVINCAASIYQDQVMKIEKSETHRRQIIYTRRIESTTTINVNAITTYSGGSLFFGFDMEVTKIW